MLTLKHFGSEPPTPREYLPVSLGVYGYFLELHNVAFLSGKWIY